MTGPNMVKTACRECPFKRSSAPGWLGSARSPQDFLNPHWYTPLRAPCHMQVDWEKAEPIEHQTETKPLCRGLIVMMRNSCKLPDNPEMEAARATVEPDRENFFGFPHEFFEHHGG